MSNSEGLTAPVKEMLPPFDAEASALEDTSILLNKVVLSFEERVRILLGSSPLVDTVSSDPGPPGPGVQHLLQTYNCAIRQSIDDLKALVEALS